MLFDTKSLLVIAAHPDDEVLGCGGTIARAARNGVKVKIMFLTDGVAARHINGTYDQDELEERENAANVSCRILGVDPPIFGSFPDNEMDTVSRLQITRTIEQVISDQAPETILTHHFSDVNIDHRRIHEAVVTACRPQPNHPVRTLAFFEVASSTEWQIPGAHQTFMPNVFVDISDTLQLKEEALGAYAQEMREWPHSRSIPAVSHLARWRGASVGVEAAEGFVLGRHISKMVY